MIAQNLTNSRCKKITQQKISIFNILTCLICTSKARMAHICPNCSKFYCQYCIKQWIKHGNQFCPNCRNTISENTIVNCNKLSQDLSSALQALIQLQTPQQSQCDVHTITQTYYCQNCTMSICSDCIVLESVHRGHSIIKLSKIKIDFNERILSILSKLRKSVKQIQKQKQYRNSIKNNQSQQLKLKIESLNNYMRKIRNQYENNFNNINTNYESLLSQNKLQQIASTKFYQQNLRQIKQISKINLVRRNTEQLQKILKESIKKTSEQFIKTQDMKVRISTEAANMITPKFVSKTFLLTNYTQLRDKKQVIYSDAFFYGPLEWRLKIYPNGLQKCSNEQSIKKIANSTNFVEEYISIYVELVTAIRESGRYQFSIEIINKEDQTKVISQIYEADFEAGKCWGYDEFANISSLYQKGYVNPNQDSLKISVSVGPPSFYYSTLDQQYMILQKQQLILKNKEKIQQLRNALKQKQKQIASGLQTAKITSQNLEQKQQSQVQPILQVNPYIIHSESQKIQIQDIKTPTYNEPIKIIEQPQQHFDKELQERKQNKSIIQNIQNQVSFQNYVIELPKEQFMRCNQQFDHQSAELRKIFRRVSQINERNSLLLF